MTKGPSNRFYMMLTLQELSVWMDPLEVFIIRKVLAMAWIKQWFSSRMEAGATI